MSSGANGAGTGRDMEMLFRAVCANVSLSMKGSAARFEEAAHMAGRLSGKLDPKAALRMLRRAAQEIGYDPDLVEGAIDREYARGQKEAIERGGDPLPDPDHVEPFPTICAASYAGKPRPKIAFLDARQFIPRGCLTTLAGAGGAGKTTIILQLMVGTATKGTWMGEPVNEDGRGVALFYSAEDPEAITQSRLMDICAAEGLDISVLKGVHIIPAENKDGLFIETKKDGVQPTADWHRLVATVEKLKPDVLAIDNRGHVVEANENDRTVAHRVSRAVNRLAQKHDLAAVLAVHPSMTGQRENTGAAGNTGWWNTSRSYLYLAKPTEEGGEPTAGDGDGKRTLTLIKSNYSQTGRVINAKWELGYYRCTDKPKRAGSDIGEADQAERVFLALLKTNAERGVNVSANPKASNYAPKQFMTSKKREGLSLKNLTDAMESLFEKGAIRAVKYGPPSDQTFRLEVV